MTATSAAPDAATRSAAPVKRAGMDDVAEADTVADTSVLVSVFAMDTTDVTGAADVAAGAGAEELAEAAAEVAGTQLPEAWTWPSPIWQTGRPETFAGAEEDAAAELAGAEAEPAGAEADADADAELAAGAGAEEADDAGTELAGAEDAAAEVAGAEEAGLQLPEAWT